MHYRLTFAWVELIFLRHFNRTVASLTKPVKYAKRWDVFTDPGVGQILTDLFDSVEEGEAF